MYVLPTERQILPNNTTITLNGTEYKILDTKGRGASCVVYLAENCTNKRIVLIKELYPINLGIFRDKENNLIVPNSFCEHFKFYKHKLCEAYKLQLEFHNSDETGNYTSDAETMVEAYSTLYVIMNKVVGSSYDKVVLKISLMCLKSANLLQQSSVFITKKDIYILILSLTIFMF